MSVRSGAMTRGSLTRCDPSSFECVECTEDSQCAAAEPVCLEGACRPCEVEPGVCYGAGPVIDASRMSTAGRAQLRHEHIGRPA